MTKAFLREHFDYNPAGFLIRKKKAAQNHRLGAIPGTKHHAGYVLIKIKNRMEMYHRVVWLWHNEKMPKIIDHINRNKADNRIENLRAATVRQNASNRSLNSRNKHGFLGVFKPKDSPHTFAFTVQYNGNRVSGRGYKTAKDAARVRDFALMTISNNCPFLTLNFERSNYE